MDEPQSAELETWLAEPLSPAIIESVSRLRLADGVKKVCLMPDVHLAKEVCVGAVVATEGVIYPQAVGNDIGCGISALPFDLPADAIDNQRAACQLLAGLYEAVPSNKHRRAQTLPDNLKPEELSDTRLAKIAKRDGAVQLGTLGRGNHFLEFQSDEHGQLWVMLHSGSRALGQAIALHHAKQATIGPAGLVGLDANSERGQAYLCDAAWARSYASENRLAMLRAVGSLMQRLFGVEAAWDELIHADHNHVQHEERGSETLFVHRKGAQSARIGEPGVVPGSMGSPSFHTKGRGCRAAFNSCSHGAGRKLSRTEARRTISPKTFQQQVGSLWFDHRRTNQLRDESPAAYKNIREVMRAQQELTKVLRELRPVLNYKGC